MYFLPISQGVCPFYPNYWICWHTVHTILFFYCKLGINVPVSLQILVTSLFLKEKTVEVLATLSTEPGPTRVNPGMWSVITGN